MSRAEPSFTGTLRGALSDAYFHSWRLVALNVLWGAGLLAVIAVAFVAPLLAALLSIVLALPMLWIQRLAAIIRRGQRVSLLAAIRAPARVALRASLLWAGALLVGGVLGVNAVTGLTSGAAVGWAFGTAAAWGLVALAALWVLTWPLIADPTASDRSLPATLRLAAALLFARTRDALALLLVSLVVLGVSTVLFAALVTIGVGLGAVIAASWVLPAADRLLGVPAAAATTAG